MVEKRKFPQGIQGLSSVIKNSAQRITGFIGVSVVCARDILADFEKKLQDFVPKECAIVKDMQKGRYHIAVVAGIDHKQLLANMTRLSNVDMHIAEAEQTTRVGVKACYAQCPERIIPANAAAIIQDIHWMTHSDTLEDKKRKLRILKNPKCSEATFR